MIFSVGLVVMVFIALVFLAFEYGSYTGWNKGLVVAEDSVSKLKWMEARIDRMTSACGWCQDRCSASEGFSPCPLHEGAERMEIEKDEITGRVWFCCPNCGAEK